MFTGIIEELGIVEGWGVAAESPMPESAEGSREGSSIAVNGVCLTAVDLRPGSFSADLAAGLCAAAISASWGSDRA